MTKLKDSLWQMENEISKQTQLYFLEKGWKYTEQMDVAIRMGVRETFYRTKKIYKIDQQIKMF